MCINTSSDMIEIERMLHDCTKWGSIYYGDDVNANIELYS